MSLNWENLYLFICATAGTINNSTSEIQYHDARFSNQCFQLKLLLYNFCLGLHKKFNQPHTNSCFTRCVSLNLMIFLINLISIRR